MNLKIYCTCCECPIQIEDDDDLRICEECTGCPKVMDGDGPCLVMSEATP